MRKSILSRRNVVLGVGMSLAMPSVLRAQTAQPAILATDPVRNNFSSFKTQRWEDHFDSLGKGAIVADLVSRALHYCKRCTSRRKFDHSFSDWG